MTNTMSVSVVIVCMIALLCIPLVFLRASDVVYLNDYAVEDPALEISILNKPPETGKSDAILVTSYGERETKVYLIDGGRANGIALTALNDLRAKLLDEQGFSGKLKDRNYKLKINLLVTHCHEDHVDELYGMILSNGRFEVESLYLAEATGLTTDGTYDNTKNSDVNQRVKLLDTLKKYHPGVRIVVVPFGETQEIEMPTGKVKLYAPCIDWGVGDALQYIVSTYYGKSPAKRRTDVPMAVMNANSMWMKVSANGYSMLFPGDVLKKYDRDDEPFDRMIDYYGAEELRSHVVKYPHHGISRNPAAKRLQKDLLVSATESFVVVGANGALEQSGAVMTTLSMNWLDSANKRATFVIDRTGLAHVE